MRVSLGGNPRLGAKPRRMFKLWRVDIRPLDCRSPQFRGMAVHKRRSQPSDSRFRGNDGVKIGNDGVKIGNDGVKMGNDGAKIGNGGVKVGNGGQETRAAAIPHFFAPSRRRHSSFLRAFASPPFPISLRLRAIAPLRRIFDGHARAICRRALDANHRRRLHFHQKLRVDEPAHEHRAGRGPRLSEEVQSRFGVCGVVVRVD